MANLIVRDDVSYDHFLYLYKKANKGKSQTEDVKELKAFIDENPDLITNSIGLAHMAMQDLIEGLFKTETERTMIEAELDRMKIEFGYTQASVIERMLFDTVLISWVRVQYLEGDYNRMFKEGMWDNQARFYTQLLNAAHQRFMRAVDTLGRLKKFHINFQVNIAADGGQQVNIQDNHSSSSD
jgi:hypothetical protein